MLDKKSKIYIAGHRGMVGSACWRKLKLLGYDNLIGASSSELDLRIQNDVYNFISKNKPDIIIDAAARVGGILANDRFPYKFLIENLQIQNNLIHSAHKLDIKKFVFLGSSCIYPRDCEQPMKESSLLTGKLEKTNEWYAIAKISGIKLIESIRKQFDRDYVSFMPTNLYGPNDNFDLKTSHVLPALIRKFHDAKSHNQKYVNLWGTGKPKREFLHVDDLASAIIFSLDKKLPHHLYNVGSETELSIKTLAKKISKMISFKGEIIWDSSKPDGTPRKIMDSSRLKKLGWKPEIELDLGLHLTYDWYRNNLDNLKYVKIR